MGVVIFVPGLAKVNRGVQVFLTAAGICLGATTSGTVHAQPVITTSTVAADPRDTSTDFLSDDDWRALPREERRARSRRSMIARFEPDGSSPTLERLPAYVAKFAELNVYDPRHYLYKVTASPVAGTTGSVILEGEVYPRNYKHGIEETLTELGFNIVENNIEALPAETLDTKPYGISTTNAATLRREPRARAEQVNSVAMGGLIRVLRTGTDADVSTASSSSRRAPNAEALQTDKPSDWVLAQTMEGYLGFARKSDFELVDDYTLPDGILKFPVTIDNEGTSFPAGVFVYVDGTNGWQLYGGKKLPASARVTDLRPDYTAEEIEELMKPFMGTKYVWGGVTNEGIDCSGFSQFFMRTSGVMIPRDAVQQATTGFIVAWGEDVLKKALPGDLVFFANDGGRISHVAISLGGPRIIHSSGRDVHLQRLDESRGEDSDETYGGRVLFARRVLAR